MGNTRSDAPLTRREELELHFLAALHFAATNLVAGESGVLGTIARAVLGLEELAKVVAAGVPRDDEERKELVSRYESWVKAGAFTYTGVTLPEAVLAKCTGLVMSFLAATAESRPRNDSVRNELRMLYVKYVDALETAVLSGERGLLRVWLRTAVLAFARRYRRERPRLTFPADEHRYCWDEMVVRDASTHAEPLYWATEDKTSLAPIQEDGVTGYPVVDYDRQFYAANKDAALAGVAWPCRLYRVAPLGEIGVSCLAGSTQELEPSDRGFSDSFSVVVVDELEPWRVFGPNGSQVVAAIEWWRGDMLPQRSKEESHRMHNEVRAAYRRRADLRFYSQYPNRWNDYTGFCADGTFRFWLRPGPLTAAWKAAAALALTNRRFNAVSYAAKGCPGLAALVLRDVLPPKHFRSLYGVLEDYLPLATLDAMAAPVGYRV
jgi:hypothetical protein